MVSKKIQPIVLTIGVAAITSLIVSALGIFLYFQTVYTKQTAPTTKNVSQDASFAKYETIINGFLNKLREGKVDDAYKETAPSFQKLSSSSDFTKLVSTWKSAGTLPSTPCSLTQYSDPFSTTIKELPDTYMVVVTKCEVKGNGEIIGFDVEFIEDNGTPKISYINIYSSPILHTK